MDNSDMFDDFDMFDNDPAHDEEHSLSFEIEARHNRDNYPLVSDTEPPRYADT